MTAAVQRIGQDQFTRLTAGALHQDFGKFRDAVNQVAEAANCNSRAARNWWDGVNAPTTLYFLRLATKAPTVRALLEFLTAIETADSRAGTLVKELAALDIAGASPEQQLTLFANKWARR